MPLFLLHTPLQDITLHLLVTALRFFLHVTLLMLSSYWMDFAVLRCTLQLSCRMPPYWNSFVFLVIHLELQILRRNITGKVLLSSHPIKVHDLCLLRLTLSLLGLSAVESAPVHTVLCGRASLGTAQHTMGRHAPTP